MPRDVARAALYRGRINLWVEDVLTREYLSTIWNDPDIAFFIAGGNQGVQAAVKDAETDRIPNVFGLIDRDYRTTNKDRWSDPEATFRTFVLPVHEVENHLLDPPALASSRYNNLKRTDDQIEEHLRDAAGGFVWWVACCEVLAKLRRRFHDGFPPHPPRNLNGLDDAANHICHSF